MSVYIYIYLYLYLNYIYIQYLCIIFLDATWCSINAPQELDRVHIRIWKAAPTVLGQLMSTQYPRLCTMIYDDYDGYQLTHHVVKSCHVCKT